MLKISIQLTSISGNTLILPSTLTRDYLRLKQHEKNVDNALRSFRPVPKLPSDLQGFAYKVFDVLPAGENVAKLHLSALDDMIYTLGLNGKKIPHLKIKVS